MSGNTGNDLFGESDHDEEAQKNLVVDSQLPSIDPLEAEVKGNQRRGWILIVLAITGCLAVIFSASIFIDLGQLPLVARYFPSPTPTLTPIPTSTPSFALVTIVPYENYSPDIPEIVDLATNWESPSAPSTLSWQVDVNQDQAVAISLGWCTTTELILNENLTHIQWLLEIDGQTIDVETLYYNKFVDESEACEGNDGLIEKWTAGTHTITRTLRVNRATNDGWKVYPVGDYVEIFIINVTD